MHSKRLKIAVFESAEFFPTSRQTENGQKVIDIQWPNEHATSDLEKPITFKINVQVSKNFHVTIRQQAKYNQLLFKPGNYTCVYWEESRSEWEISGLTTVNSGKDGQVVCQTTHLTGFSILLVSCA